MSEITNSTIIERWLETIGIEANEPLCYVVDAAGHRITTEEGETVSLASDWDVMAAAFTREGLEELLERDLSE